ncbi:hypothetical protein J2Z69_000083 [Paenibacillus shirakamiensis]|uniref:YneQ n=1 Tax=Paenibacillus shirakamiensis TaxID=1265935 RepID=A0ABS4JEQ2_9BACL|nr:hypothetical protein [Paenibacillus shirakamiensis]MBP1999064.1 hypothetical protein [Paenibacillus shirakamiensis]
MAFGIQRSELKAWKASVADGEIAYLTHFWYDSRFPDITTVTKVGCSDLTKLTQWCQKHQLNPKYIHLRPPFPHFDLMGRRQREILRQEEVWEQIDRFHLTD